MRFIADRSPPPKTNFIRNETRIPFREQRERGVAESQPSEAINITVHFNLFTFLSPSHFLPAFLVVVASHMWLSREQLMLVHDIVHRVFSFFNATATSRQLCN